MSRSVKFVLTIGIVSLMWLMSGCLLGTTDYPTYQEVDQCPFEVNDKRSDPGKYFDPKRGEVDLEPPFHETIKNGVCNKVSSEKLQNAEFTIKSYQCEILDKKENVVKVRMQGTLKVNEKTIDIVTLDVSNTRGVGSVCEPLTAKVLEEMIEEIVTNI